MVSFSPPVADSVLPFTVKCDRPIVPRKPLKELEWRVEHVTAADLGLDGTSQLHCVVWVTLMFFVNQHIFGSVAP